MEQVGRSLSRDWEAVGGYLSNAMQEVAVDLGGEEFADYIVDISRSDEVLPNPIALKLLEDSFPGSAELVMARSAEIQQQAFESELASIQKTSVRKYGRAMLYSIYKKSLHPLTHYHRP
jgi:hypothetical protein